jgi:NAD(P)-dependent dehydrogenase (short-subunit alcohol dehydrogenase family)
MLDAAPEFFERVQRVNLVGLAFLSQAAARRMIE